MKGKRIYPKNTAHFKKLITLTKKVILICQKNKINPTIYGSFAHFYHTQDEKMKVKDIDILIKENGFSKLPPLLEKSKIKFRFYPYGIIIKEGKLKIELDKMEREYNSSRKSFFKNTKKVDFYGVKVNILSLKQLEDIYKVAILRTKEDKLKIGKKIEHLENFLGRKLK